MGKFYELGFGKEKLTVALDDKNVIAELRPNEVERGLTGEAEVRR